MKPISIIPPVTNTVRMGTPELHNLSRRVMKSGPVWPRRARVCSTRDAMYIELMAQVHEEKTNMALKKWATAGIPASTTAMMKSDRAPTDWPSPLSIG